MIQTLIDFSTALGPVRDQGTLRGMCLAFASSDFNQHENGLQDHLSVEYLAHHAVAATPGWTHNDGLNFPEVVQVLAATGQPLESVYPYVEANMGQPLVSPPLISTGLYKCKTQQSGAAAQIVVAALLASKPACLGMALNDEWFYLAHGVIQYVPTYTSDRHAVLAVGLGFDPVLNERFVLIRNSWGPGWGNNGHAWLPERYLQTHLIESLIS